MTDPRSSANTRQRSAIARASYIALAYICVGLGLAGVVLPLLPTTPFLLLAAWSASRGSPRLHRWLYQHPYIGQVLQAWERERAVPRSAKVSACVLLSISWIGIWWLTGDWRLLTVTGLLFVVVAGFLLTRPAPGSRPSK